MKYEHLHVFEWLLQIDIFKRPVFLNKMVNEDRQRAADIKSYTRLESVQGKHSQKNVQNTNIFLLRNSSSLIILYYWEYVL